MPDKRQQMLDFWSERAQRYGADATSNTNDVWLRRIEIDCVNRVIRSRPLKRILDFGCANGYSTIKLAMQNPDCDFVGIDLNQDMINIAQGQARDHGSPNLEFRHLDVLREPIDERFDLIYSVRAFQNIESVPMQQRVFDRLEGILDQGGLLYCIESYADGYARLSMDRVKMNLPPLPSHPHLTLLTDEFDTYAARRMELLERSWPSSSYYLVTRLLYSYIAMINKEPIDYQHPIHQVGTLIPQIGEYGPQRAMLWQKRGASTG